MKREPELLFCRQRHYDFIKKLDVHSDTFFYWQASYLRMNGVYWALASLFFLDPEMCADSVEFSQKSPLSKESILDFVIDCQQPNGGFSGNIGDDPHIIFTLSAIQILVLIGCIEDGRISVDKHVEWILARQNADGSFCGDEAGGEVDNRFSYCAIASLSLLKRLPVLRGDDSLRQPCVRFIISCQNPDGGFGAVPGAESHAGQIFCCTAALRILGEQIPKSSRLAEWLSWRQLPSGGLNGRPEKLQDVCYSWWVLSSLSVLEKDHWISQDRLKDFILECQDEVGGGIADRPGDFADIFHTLFGITGLSLIGDDEGFANVDALYCLPKRFTETNK